MPEVSIIIVCMNRPDNLYPCLDSIAAEISAAPGSVGEEFCEVLVVAYMFSPENLERARRDYPWVKFIVSDELRGFAENNNLALRQAGGRYCFILNDDTEYSGPVIGHLVEDLERLPSDAAIVSPRILNADGSLQLCGRPPYPSRYYALQQWHLHREPTDDTAGRTPEFGSVYRTSNITGACFLIRTEVFRSLGWFDETYYFTPEDIALSTLARERGYGVYVDAGVCITHKWRTTASRISPAVRPAAVKGSLIFFGRGSALKRFLLSLSVWAAESVKRIKAAVRYRRNPTEENRIKLQTFRNITRSIFGKETPKSIFIRYYRSL